MKIGIFGGSFNPIHTGHAIIANYIAQNSDLDAVWMMVSPLNPLKTENLGASDTDRLRMTEMVTRQLEKVTTSAFEFSMPKPSYTINTLQDLSKRFPNAEFTLIIGADNWYNFKQWKDYEEILANYKILVYPRMGFDIVIPEQYNSNVSIVDAPVIELSSTIIRQGIKNQQNMCFYLPSQVYQYILENRLYMYGK